MTVEPFAWLAEAGVALRAYRGVEDVAGIQAVRAAVRRVDGDIWLPGPDDTEDTDDPTAPQPFCLVATDVEHDAIIGFSWMHWWTEADGTRLYLLSGCVDPGWRGRGVGTAILSWQEEQAISYDRTEPAPATSQVFGVNVAPDESVKLAMVTAHGYRLAFTHIEMAYDLGAHPIGEVEPLPAGLVLRPVEPAHHRKIHELIEECFAGSRTGYLARTYEDYLGDVRDIELWLVAWDGDEIAAVVVNEVEPDGSTLSPYVAVRAGWRRRGVGLALMRHTLRACADRGVKLARLTTVQENPDNPVGLYERAGYIVTDRQPRYRKPMPTG